METSSAEKFADELKWCINQLELGLQRQSPDSRHAQETFKILKILRSSKAPLIKKRQAMRNALGDYRKKIKDEEKKSLNAMKHSKFKSTSNMKVFRNSKFLRQSHTREVFLEQQNEDNKALSMDMNSLYLQQPLSLEFSSSPISPHNTLFSQESSTLTQPSSANDKCQMSLPSISDCDKSLLSAPSNGSVNGISNNDESSSSGFKFCPSDNSFAFSFDVRNSCDETDNNVVNGETKQTMATDMSSDLDGAKCSIGSNDHFKFEKSDNLFTFNFGV